MTNVRPDHPNYSRQVVQQFRKMLDGPRLAPGLRPVLENALWLAQSAQKFLLPDGGRLYDDMQYRALDETVPLRLPFSVVALEYRQTQGIPVSAEERRSTKRIVFAREAGDRILVNAIFWADEVSRWIPLPEASLPVVGFIDRAHVLDGRVAIRATGAGLWNVIGDMTDVADELGALLCFLNYLQCSNTSIVRSDPKSLGRKVKSALPFDSYYLLQVQRASGCSASNAGGGDRRSPREHVRRGHIRVYESGLKIWVNHAIVNGASGGQILKDYNLRAAA